MIEDPTLRMRETDKKGPGVWLSHEDLTGRPGNKSIPDQTEEEKSDGH